ncbi:hypothetical protein RCL_jg7988.t1 [Rhizophagus clarus]|uniref:Uncharacterized protein n=1 Tax=Rhizophagus clarus TaxID=94130 RepID=A0A8H3MCC2_9GLOM|nr:hypothetical protein RCL_jg7988.t1 [Rhizophagus clarus]
MNELTLLAEISNDMKWTDKLSILQTKEYSDSERAKDHYHYYIQEENWFTDFTMNLELLTYSITLCKKDNDHVGGLNVHRRNVSPKVHFAEVFVDTALASRSDNLSNFKNFVPPKIFKSEFSQEVRPYHYFKTDRYMDINDSNFKELYLTICFIFKRKSYRFVTHGTYSLLEWEEGEKEEGEGRRLEMEEREGKYNLE